MSTKNIVPRADGEGGLGTSAKKWLNGFFKNITVQTEANVPTPSDSDNSTKAATTAFVENTFFAKLVTKLAANTAASISSLNTSSLFYRMLSWALTASGVQYNFTNSSAWYICFGSLLGGLIIQGGKRYIPTTSDWAEQLVSISFTEYNWLIFASVGVTNAVANSYTAGLSKFYYKATLYSGGAWNNEPLFWIAFGK